MFLYKKNTELDIILLKERLKIPAYPYHFSFISRRFVKMSKNVQIGVFDFNSGCLLFQTHRTTKRGIRAGVWLAMPPLNQTSYHFVLLKLLK